VIHRPVESAPRQPRRKFPRKRRLLLIVPAGPPIAYESAGHHRGRHRAARTARTLARRAIVIALQPVLIAVRMLGWTARLMFRLGRQFGAAAWMGAGAIAAGLRSAAAFAARTLGTAYRIAIAGWHGLRSRGVELAGAAKPAVARTARRLMAGAHAAADQTRRGASAVGVAGRAAFNRSTIAIARVRESGGRLSTHIDRVLRSIRRWIGIGRDVTTQSLRPWLHQQTLRMTRALSALRQPTARRLTVRAGVTLGIVATGVLAMMFWNATRTAAPADAIVETVHAAKTSSPALESRPPAIDATGSPRNAEPPTGPPPREPGRSIADAPRPVRSPQPRRAVSTAAIQRVLNKYRDAYSTLNVAAVTAAWPSADARALRTAFDRLAEHNVDYESCRISASETRAAAVCHGVTQSVRVGDQTSRTERRRWQFALDKIEDRWLISAVDSR
jgi:hypothetical protein